MSVHPIVTAYCRAINAKNLDDVVALFASSGSLVNPVGTFSGVDEIRGFYRDVVFAGQAVIEHGDVVVDGDIVMAEIKATSPLDPSAGTAHAIDVFRIDAKGKITSLEIYYR